MDGLAKLNELIAAEGDCHQWEHAGLACAIVRHPHLHHWCGYVGVPVTHGAHSKSYDDIHEWRDISVHGGLTYASDCAPDTPKDGLWWVGFDCAHSGDLSPGMSWGPIENFVRDNTNGGDETRETYRTAEWVRAETNRLAEQLANLPA